MPILGGFASELSGEDTSKPSLATGEIILPEPTPLYVGRTDEVMLVGALASGTTEYSVLNIHGPGGIGKSIVAQRMSAYARECGFPAALVDCAPTDLTGDRILRLASDELCKSPALEDAFTVFKEAHEDYLTVQDVLRKIRPFDAFYDVAGQVKDPSGLTQVLSQIGRALSERTKSAVQNRYKLEGYLRGSQDALTTCFATAIDKAARRAGYNITLIFDTYDAIESSLDDWVCDTLVPSLPDTARLVILGRNSLARVNFEWGDFGKALHTIELPDLAEDDARRYLQHFGLADKSQLDAVYRFTGGYPLLLVLAVHLAREAGGWERIGAMEASADRDRVARQLLERILREERAREVQAFLEKGVIATWFDPGIVSAILEVSADDGRIIYDKLGRHSFAERHLYGLKFHDKIREILLERLRFNQSEYLRLTELYIACLEKRSHQVADS